jgi:hypothetical protein
MMRRRVIWGIDASVLTDAAVQIVPKTPTRACGRLRWSAVSMACACRSRRGTASAHMVTAVSTVSLHRIHVTTRKK